MIELEQNVASVSLNTPSSFSQTWQLARYQFSEYVAARRFVALLGIALIAGVAITAIVGYYRGSLVSSSLAFYGSFWGGGIGFISVLAAVFFGGDSIAGEFERKTGYFLMGLPLRRSTIYTGKFIAAYLASLCIIALYLAILVGNGIYYFGTGAFPWQLGLSLLLTFLYLAAVISVAFLFSSFFKTSVYGFVITIILFLFGFSILQTLLVDLVKIQPWMIISYASSSLSDVFQHTVNWGLSPTVVKVTASSGRRPVVLLTEYTAGVAESVVIMVGYLIAATVAGLLRFEREEFS